jgi:hypothetical protein
MADGVKSATLPTGTKVTGPAHVIDAMLGKRSQAEESAPKRATKKAAAKSEK